MQPLHIGRDFKKEFEYHGRAMKLILDSLRKEQEEEKPVICEWCSDEIQVMSPAQKTLLADFNQPCCIDCYREGIIAEQQMWSDLQAQQSL